MVCEFKKTEDGKCIFHKHECTVKEEDIPHCKYYRRQYPETEELFVTRFVKAAQKAIKARDFKNKFSDIVTLNKHIGDYQPNFKKSIHDNVRRLLADLEGLDFQVKKKKNLDPSDLKGNVLANIVNNLYIDTNVKMVQRQDDQQSIVVLENDEKYLCKLKIPVTQFIRKVVSVKNKTEFYKTNIEEKTKI